MSRTPIAERFWQKVNKDGPLLPPMKTRCWEWTASCQPSGYGQIRERGKIKLVHRVSFEMHKGEIPPHLHVDHICNNRKCVRPGHLRLLDPLANVQRSLRWSGNWTHCKHGHEFTPENTGRNSRGARRCLPCAREYDKKRRPRKANK